MRAPAIRSAGVGLALLLVMAGCGQGASTEATSQQPPAVEGTLGSTDSVALALQVKGPRGGQMPPTAHGYCSTWHSVVCWHVSDSYAHVLAEMRGHLHALRAGPVDVRDRTPSSGPLQTGYAVLDVVDGHRHVQVEILSEVTGTYGHGHATGVQTVIVVADPA